MVKNLKEKKNQEQTTDHAIRKIAILQEISSSENTKKTRRVSLSTSNKSENVDEKSENLPCKTERHISIDSVFDSEEDESIIFVYWFE